MYCLWQWSENNAVVMDCTVLQHVAPRAEAASKTLAERTLKSRHSLMVLQFSKSYSSQCANKLLPITMHLISLLLAPALSLSLASLFWGGSRGLGCSYPHNFQRCEMRQWIPSGWFVSQPVPHLPAEGRSFLWSTQPAVWQGRVLGNT